MISSIILTLFGYIASSEAYEACKFLKNNTVLLYCPDKGAYIGYCCGYNSYYDVDTACCYYTAVYGLWYFWICILIFICLVALCGACFKRASDARKPASVRTSTTSNNQGTTYETATYTVPQGSTEAVVTVVEDKPPSYNEVQQGIQAQQSAMASYGTQPPQHHSSSSSSDEHS